MVGCMGDLSQEDLCQHPSLPALLLPVPWTPRQATVDPHLHRRLPDTHSPHHRMKPEASHLSQNQSPLEIPCRLSALHLWHTTRLHKTEIIQKACHPNLGEVSSSQSSGLRKIHYFIESWAGKSLSCEAWWQRMSSTVNGTLENTVFSGKWCKRRYWRRTGPLGEHHQQDRVLCVGGVLWEQSLQCENILAGEESAVCPRDRDSVVTKFDSVEAIFEHYKCFLCY